MKLVFEINDKYLPKLMNYYQACEVDTTTPYMKKLYKTDDFTITVFNSKKVLFQGENGLVEFKKWQKIIGFESKVPDPIPETSYMNDLYNVTCIGSDEVGTGDFFGPVIVTAAVVGPKDYPFLSEFNIQDSKNISDQQILSIAPHLIEVIPHQTIILNNIKFNEVTQKGYNLNKVKAYLHNHAIKKLIHKKVIYKDIIVDKFSSEENYFSYLADQEVVRDIKLIEKAESVHQSVAVAAIIARYTFLLEMDKLSDSIHLTLPKGASAAVDAIGKLIYLKHGEAVFNRIAKVNFKNMQKIRD